MAGQSFLDKRVLSLAAILLALAPGLTARKFYDDDPVQTEPSPMNMEKIKGRRLSDYYDYFLNTFGKPGERNGKGKFIRAQGVNTLGEVPDCPWYTNRHFKVRMSIEDLVRGAGGDNPPDTSGVLTVVAARTEGTTPGFTIRDSRGRRYVVKFDPLTNPEMTTAADVISSKFFYALGYNVPDNYIFSFTRQQIVVAPDVTLTDARGKRRPMRDRDVTDLLLGVARTKDGRYRALASLYLKGQPVGEFRYHGTRGDDPNDSVPHEHRRDLRGLRVFCAWLAHEDSRAINTWDGLVEENRRRFVKHHLIDFGSTLGSQSTGPKSPLWGHEYLFAWKPAATQFFTLGLYVPRWTRAKYPKIPAVGRFEADIFDPEKWVPEYHNPAFSNTLPDDTFWAAKQVMAFTDEEIHAIVKTGQYSDPEAKDWVVQCLIKRRDKIGRAYFDKVLPFDRFDVKDVRLVFEDLAVKHKLVSSRAYTIQWYRFDNNTEQKTALPGETTFTLPKQLHEAPPGDYFSADIHGGDKQKTVTVYLRKMQDGVKVVGVDRTW